MAKANARVIHEEDTLKIEKYAKDCKDSDNDMAIEFITLLDLLNEGLDHINTSDYGFARLSFEQAKNLAFGIFANHVPNSLSVQERVWGSFIAPVTKERIAKTKEKAKRGE